MNATTIHVAVNFFLYLLSFWCKSPLKSNYHAKLGMVLEIKLYGAATTAGWLLIS
jgi:hypothetical protein